MGLKSQDPYYMSPLKNPSEQRSTESVYSSKKSSVSIVALISQIGPHSFKAQLSWGRSSLWWESRMTARLRSVQVAPDPRELLCFCERLCAIIGKVLLRSGSFARPSLLSPVIWKKESAQVSVRTRKTLWVHNTTLGQSWSSRTTGL